MIDYMMGTRVTKSPEETQALGEEIGSKLVCGDIVAITGELGAGKTCLAQGLGWGIGVDPKAYMTSPSFTLVKEYRGRIPVYHIDLFRLKSIKEAYDLPIEDYFFGKHVTIIEWADKIESLLPPEHIRIDIEIVSENERRIRIHPRD
jgi:tRNA threonylcarbamoyladenosine biosynthesis protein TsaE